jgi:hypothetical protein
MDRQEAYGVLADLIFKGFLTSELSIEDKALIFKTVNEKEFDLIKLYSGNPKNSGYQVRFNIYFLIFSLFMLDNQFILCTRNENLTELYNFFAGIPEKVFRKMMTRLNDVRIIVYDSLKYLEGFSYTNFSRNMWKSLRNNLPSSSEFTGIPGTSEMGMNVHQESWVMINRSLDYEEEYNKDFSLAVLVASASNPKGSRHIRSQHDSMTKGIEDRRKKLAQEGFIDTTKWTPEGWAAPVDTAEELVAELNRQMTGQKDKHDIFMDNYLKKIREEAERKTREAEERIKRFQEGHDNVLIDGSQRALTVAETKELMNRKRPNTVMVADEEKTSPEDHEKFHKKIGARVLTPQRK